MTENVRLVNVRHGNKDQGRDIYIYATLVRAENGVALIHATLDYILQAIAERKYNLVGDKNV